MVLLCPSAKCNANCDYCIYKKDNNGQIMDENVAYDIVNQFAEFGSKAIDFCGLGDPLVTPYADNLMYHIHQRKMKFGVITNGINLKGDIMKMLLNYGSYVRISLDSAVPEEYKKMKGVDQCEKVKENIIKALEYKKQNQLKCDISIKILLTAINNPIELTKTLMFIWQEVPEINSLQIRCARNIEKYLELDDKNKESIENMVKELLIAHSDKFPIERLRINLQPTSIDHKCWLSPLHATVMSDGKMYICCYYTNRPEKHCIGDLSTNTLKEIWGSARHKEAIKDIKVEECNIYDCKFHNHHIEIEHLLNSDTPEFI